MRWTGGPAELREISFTVLGTGSEMDALKARAAKSHPNVQFPGYSSEVARKMAEADLLVHTCPVEPFGLVILEAIGGGFAGAGRGCGGAGGDRGGRGERV